MTRSYAHGVNTTLQDRLLEWFPLSGAEARGYYFVEAGAHDGCGDSQTLWLERRGWEGLCVEPSLSGTTGLRRNRSCRIDHRCLWDASGVVPFVEVDGNERELSGIPSCFYDSWNRASYPHTERTVEALPLHAMLADHQAPGVVNFMCLDTEGSEVRILAAHDFGRFRIRAMWVEYNNITSRRDELIGLLTPKGYRVELDTTHDLLFVEGELS